MFIVFALILDFYEDGINIQFKNYNDFLILFVLIAPIILDITFNCINKIKRLIAVSRMSDLLKRKNKLFYEIKTETDVKRLMKQNGLRVSNSKYAFKLLNKIKKPDELFFYINGNSNVFIKKSNGEIILKKSIDLLENINHTASCFYKTSVFISDKRIIIANRHMLSKNSPKNITFEFPLHSIKKKHICGNENISSVTPFSLIHVIEFELGIKFSTDEYNIQFLIIEDARLFSKSIPNDYITIRNWIYEIFVYEIKNNKSINSISTPLKNKINT